VRGNVRQLCDSGDEVSGGVSLVRDAARKTASLDGEAFQIMFSKFGSNRTAVSQILEIWRGRTEPEPNIENIISRGRA
jgi:hypothetical protein